MFSVRKGVVQVIGVCIQLVNVWCILVDVIVVVEQCVWVVWVILYVNILVIYGGVDIVRMMFLNIICQCDIKFCIIVSLID